MLKTFLSRKCREAAHGAVMKVAGPQAHEVREVQVFVKAAGLGVLSGPDPRCLPSCPVLFPFPGQGQVQKTTGTSGFAGWAIAAAHSPFPGCGH